MVSPFKCKDLLLFPKLHYSKTLWGLDCWSEKRSDLKTSSFTLGNCHGHFSKISVAAIFRNDICMTVYLIKKIFKK